MSANCGIGYMGTKVAGLPVTVRYGYLNGAVTIRAVQVRTPDGNYDIKDALKDEVLDKIATQVVAWEKE